MLGNHSASLNYPEVHAQFLVQKEREMRKQLAEQGARYREPGATPCHLLSDKMPPNTHVLNTRDRREQLSAAGWLSGGEFRGWEWWGPEIFWWMQLHRLSSLCNMLWVSNSKKWTQRVHNTCKNRDNSLLTGWTFWPPGASSGRRVGEWQGEALHVVLSLPFSVPIFFF